MAVVIERFSIYLTALDPAVGAEMRKTRPCVVVSPDESNRHLRTVIIAPMTTRTRDYPTRIPCRFRGRVGEIALDQIRTVDRQRLTKRLGALDTTTLQRVRAALQEMFS